MNLEVTKTINKAAVAKLHKLAEQLPESRRNAWLTSMFRMLTTQDDDVLKTIKYNQKPVGVREFMESPFYLGKKGDIYPAVMIELEKMNCGDYDEVVCTGGIGAAKTSVALYSTAYQIYLLSCLRNPHREFALDRNSEIKIIIQSLNAKLAKGVDYERFRDMIEQSPYFQRHFPFEKDIESALMFPNRIELEPLSGTETGAIGQNIIGGIIDEVNFMSVVENSKLATDGTTYDQAHALYNTIARRRKSRFMKMGGKIPGILFLVSSRKVPGQFTDVKEEEAKTNPRIYIYDKRTWDIKPEGTYSGEKFRIFLGDELRKPRILADDEVVPDSDDSLIDHVPVEYLDEFQRDITKAIRDIAGRSTMAIHPYMVEREKILSNFGKVPLKIMQPKVNFINNRPKLIKGSKFDPRWPRWIHIDLGLRSDNAGVSMAHVPEFITVNRGDHSEVLPVIEFDFNIAVEAPKNGEIEFSEIRGLIYRLRDLGVPIRWVSLDSFQSADTMQILRQKGFSVGYVSVDTTMVPYDMYKQALYDGRAPTPSNPLLQQEILSLERDMKKGKIDHPPKGSKDVADSAAGCVYGLTTRREIWSMHKVPLTQALSVVQAVEAARETK